MLLGVLTGFSRAGILLGMSRLCSLIACFLLLMGLPLYGENSLALSDKYKSIIGDEFYVSESDHQWSPFHWSVPTAPFRKTDDGRWSQVTRDSLEKILLAQALYLMIDQEPWQKLVPYTEAVFDHETTLDILREQGQGGQYPRYTSLAEEMVGDLTEVVLVKIGFDILEMPSDPKITEPLVWRSAVKVIYLLGRTPSGHLVGLQTFSVET